jgi:peptidoglycan/xylan/chitin deacetylase (PgdA/CDA1 family)
MPARLGIALVYHRIGDQGDPKREIVPALDRRHFREQLLLLGSQYHVVACSSLLEAVASRRRGEPLPVVLTFDDDLRSHVEEAAPVLSELGLPAAFFLCGASLDHPYAFWWERLQRAFDLGAAESARALVADVLAGAGAAAPGARARTVHELKVVVEELQQDARQTVAAGLAAELGADPDDAGLRAGDVRTLAGAGFEIGFHTRRHDSLDALDDDALAVALAEGKADLEEAAGRNLTMIAYPHMAADGRVAAASRDAGFTLGFGGPSQAIRAEDDHLLIGRIEPLHDPLLDFEGQLLRELASRVSR